MSGISSNPPPAGNAAADHDGDSAPAPSSDLAKAFEPGAIEARWAPVWESRGYYAAGETAGRPSFCIQLPPPNVTGVLHMGHAFNQTIMDALTRYHRMRGFNTLWVPGVDHAGIATQIVVERQLQAHGVSRHDLGREQFEQRVWAWKEQSGGTITQQMRRLGASVDWTREYFTMDEKLSPVVLDTFVRLYEQGLIYPGKRLVNWDPVLKTAISDLEVVAEEEEGKLYHLRYPLADGSGQLVVATTRPETMRRGEGHAGTRLQRLPGGATARTVDVLHLHARCARHRRQYPRSRRRLGQVCRPSCRGHQGQPVQQSSSNCERPRHSQRVAGTGPLRSARSRRHHVGRARPS
jgi:hypothetical protein